MNTCTICHGTGSISTTRKTLGGDRVMQVTCNHCYGSGKELETFCHKDLTIVKFEDNKYEIVEMQSETTSLERAKGFIDEAYKSYKETCDPELDGSFLEYIHECLENAYEDF